MKSGPIKFEFDEDPKGQPFALPWYENKASYDAVLAMLPAPERQDPFTYDIFMANIKNREKEIQRKGGVTSRIPIDAVTLKGWCDANNLAVCRKSVMEYISIALALRLKGSGRN